MSRLTATNPLLARPKATDIPVWMSSHDYSGRQRNLFKCYPEFATPA
jgi:hypothetical protein